MNFWDFNSFIKSELFGKYTLSLNLPKIFYCSKIDYYMTTEIYILTVLVLIFLTLGFWIIRLENKLRKLLAGKSSTLDDSFSLLQNKIASLEKFRANTIDHLIILDKKSQHAISGVETIRFNPFKGAGEGGNQSFATAIVNEHGNGVIISSLYSRDHTSVFSKPVHNMKSPFEMTAEEKEALQKAQESANTRG